MPSVRIMFVRIDLTRIGSGSDNPPALSLCMIDTQGHFIHSSFSKASSHVLLPFLRPAVVLRKNCVTSLKD